MNTAGVTRILLIEDSPTDALLIREAFADIPDFDYELEHAELLREGLANIRAQHISVVLLDLGLPDSNGIETFRSLHRQQPDLPILVLTALDDITVGLKAVGEGAQDYLVKKDIHSTLLRRALRYAMERQDLLIELRQSRDRLRKLAAHLQTAREYERTRISREIHDELGQKMSALKMDLKWLETRMAQLPAHEQRATVGKRLREAEQLVNKVIETVQRIAIELRPSVLDHLGLVDAIRDESRRFEANTGIHVVLALSDELPVHDREVATTFFRIYQELLTNVVRHAKAKTVEVSFGETEDQFVLAVSDDGVGMPCNMDQLNTSLGLLGMQERAAGHHGQVLFASQEGLGTHVIVKIPLGEAQGISA